MRRKRSFDPGGHRRLLTVGGPTQGPSGIAVEEFYLRSQNNERNGEMPEDRTRIHS
jgi:hypothetical protein